MKQQKRIIYVTTTYDTLEIVNLKRVWVNKLWGEWRLMYEDDIYEYNLIYWNNNNPNLLKSYKNKLIQAYNRGDTIIELL